jgi:hypothetical protein
MIYLLVSAVRTSNLTYECHKLMFSDVLFENFKVKYIEGYLPVLNGLKPNSKDHHEKGPNSDTLHELMYWWPQGSSSRQILPFYL